MTLLTDFETAPAAAPAHIEASAPAARWSLATRLAFRFVVIYFSLYVLLTQMFGALFDPPFFDIPPPGSSWSVQTAVSWLAVHVFGFADPIVRFSGSGDKPYDWTLAATLLGLSAVLTAVWSWAARGRTAHPTTHTWFRLFLRFALGATMIGYGMAKAIPLQMPFPFLHRLLEPYGNFSLMGVLWQKLGSSPPYEIFTGIVEVICGVLLFIPGLTVVGALLSAATATQIFMLNMTYDVPVKLFSFHLIVMSLVLLAPDARRLFHAIVLRRAVGAAPDAPLARSPRTRRLLVAAQLVLGAWIVGSGLQGSIEGWTQYGGGAPNPPLYGIWRIDRMTIDGVERAPLVTDYDRWRHMVIQSGTGVMFQRMDATFQGFGAQVDTAARTITFRRGAGPQATDIGKFTFEQPSPDRLIAEGTLLDKPMRLEATLIDHTKFQLYQNRFRWIQDFPFNR